MLRLYDSPLSGNCYKVRLLLAQLGIAYERVHVDITADPRPPALLRHNPTGRVPLLQLEDGRFLPESNAILWHLATGSRYLPDEDDGRQRVLQWLFFEQNGHEPNIAVARYWISILKRPQQYAAPLELRQRAGHGALAVMERWLGEHAFFVSDRYSIADIALYAYTHVAREGGFDLDRFPAVCQWIARVEAQPGWVPMLRTAHD